MSVVSAIIVGLMLLLGLSAVLAFYWAARHGQFRDIERGSRVIFDEGEPVGQPTDVIWRRKGRREIAPKA